MEPLQGNIKAPSKTFIFRAIAAIVVVVIFILWQQKFFSGKDTLIEEVSPEQKTVMKGSLLKDSNGNGIADWEEQLWGLDPTVETTNGIANKTLIEERKKQLQQKNSGPTNKTDELAQNIYVINSTLDTDNPNSQQIANNAMEKLSETIKVGEYRSQFTKKDFRIVPTTTAALTKYNTELIKKTSIADTYDNEIEIIVEATESGNTDNVSKLITIGKQYQALAASLATIPTPTGIAYLHLSLVNNFNNMGKSLIDSAKISEDPVAAISSIAAYRNYSESLQNTAEAIQNYLVRYTIE